MVDDILFCAVFAAAILQRLSELWISKRNAEWMLSYGGLKIEEKNYKLVIIVMIVFYTGVPLEHFLLNKNISSLWPLLLTIYFAAQFLRYSAMLSLGRHWNTEIWVIPNKPPIRKGPYRFVSHPNYIAVVFELITLSLIAKAYITGIVSLAGYAIFLIPRIRTENKALRKCERMDSDFRRNDI